MKKKLIIILSPIILILISATIMDNTRKKNWFEGSNNLQTELVKVDSALKDIGQYFTALTRLMPGVTDVKLIEQGDDFVSIQTNEGIMKRTNIVVESINSKITIEFDEEYKAGKAITSNSHFLHTFKAEENSVSHHMVISSLKAPGFLGFFYRNFGSRNIGKAFLAAHKNYFEK